MTLFPVDEQMLRFGLELVESGDVARNQWGSFTCAHRYETLVRRVNKNKAVVVGKQCSVCGKFELVAKSTVPDVVALPGFKDFDGAYREAITALFHNEKNEERSTESKSWWGAYEVYLATPVWKARRAKVMARAGGLCEACADAPATEVHHTTYQHLGNEPLWELRAVCEPCHERITELDRAARGR